MTMKVKIYPWRKLDRLNSSAVKNDEGLESVRISRSVRFYAVFDDICKINIILKAHFAGYFDS